MASREGLNTSEWLRNLIILELKKGEALPNVIREPSIGLELNDNE
jgi:hypothetical protein